MASLDLTPLSAVSTVRSGRAVLAVESTGSGTPTVVCLHAGVADRRSWRPIGPWVTDRHRMLAYDRRGFGDTRVEGPEPHDDVADLLRVMDHADVHRAVLVGNSMGGGIAVDMALAHPDRVAGLVMLCSGPSGAPWPDDPPEFEPVVTALREAGERGDVEAENLIEARIWLDGMLGEEGRVHGEARRLFLSMNGRALRAPDVGEAVEREPAWPRMGWLAMPVTFVVGTLDEPGAIVVAQHAVELLPDARLEVLEGVGHLPTLEVPQRVAEIVLDVAARAADDADV